MSDPKSDQNPDIPQSGTILRALNGDVLRYDATGVQVILSDKTISDIANRLPKRTQEAVTEVAWVDPEVLGDIDAWDVRHVGEWYVFNAHLEGAQGPRQFRRLVEPDHIDQSPAIVADTAGALMGILCLGGPRRATGFPLTPKYPWHILAPNDEIGAVGLAGSGEADVQSTMQSLTEMTHGSTLAEVLLSDRHAKHQALPIYMTRAETDSSASIRELSDGLAFDNLIKAAKSLQASAHRLNKRAVLAAIGIEFALEDTRSDARTYRNGMFDLIAKLTAELARLGLRRPPLLAMFDCGTHHINDHPVLRAQWELAWQGPEHGLYYVAPNYMFKQDPFGRPHHSAILQMAEMEAAALGELQLEQDWFCPTFLLAEREKDPCVIRVTARAMGDLMIDQADPFGVGPTRGFSFEGTRGEVTINNVSICPEDKNALLITCDKPPKGKEVTLLYAFGGNAKRKGFDYPAACGSIRDTWAQKSRTQETLHRWALPAALPVH